MQLSAMRDPYGLCHIGQRHLSHAFLQQPSCFSGMTHMQLLINSQMASLTRRNDMRSFSTERKAGTKMTHGQHDQPLGPLGWLPVPLDTATGAGMRPMQATFAETFTAPLRANIPNHVTKGFPVWRIEGLGASHGILPFNPFQGLSRFQPARSIVRIFMVSIKRTSVVIPVEQ
jgi:hypothetical protein